MKRIELGDLLTYSNQLINAELFGDRTTKVSPCELITSFMLALAESANNRSRSTDQEEKRSIENTKITEEVIGRGGLIREEKGTQLLIRNDSVESHGTTGGSCASSAVSNHVKSSDRSIS